MKRKICVAVVAGALAAPALAQDDRSQTAYLGMDVVVVSNSLEYETAAPGFHREPYTSAHLRLKAGYRFTKIFGIEAQAISRREDTLNDAAGVPARMSTGPIRGLYARADLPLGEYAGLYGLVGVTSVTTKYRATPASLEDEETRRAFSFGAGIEVIVTKQLRASADLMVFRVGAAKYPNNFPIEDPDQVVSGLGLGLNYTF